MSEQKPIFINTEDDVAKDRMDEIIAVGLDISRLDDKIEQIELELKDAKAMRKSYSDHILKLMTGAGLSSFSHANVGTIEIEDEFRASVKDEFAAFDYLRSIGLGANIKQKESIHWKTLNCEVKRLINEGGVPCSVFEDNGIGIFKQEVVRVRGAK